MRPNELNEAQANYSPASQDFILFGELIDALRRHEKGINDSAANTYETRKSGLSPEFFTTQPVCPVKNSRTRLPR
jgi:hypothetical protein